MNGRPARRFEDFIFWLKSHALTLRVYKFTTEFPARDLRYVPHDSAWDDVDDVARLLSAYVRTLLAPSS
jgi:hypothetical protein